MKYQSLEYFKLVQEKQRNHIDENEETEEQDDFFESNISLVEKNKTKNATADGKKKKSDFGVEAFKRDKT